jgi:hypothetical protein
MKKPVDNELVHFHGPKVSEPHEGHGGTRYEGVDASVKMVIWSLVIIVITLVIALAITVPIQRTMRDITPEGKLPSPLAPARVIPKGPLIEVHPWETLPQVNARENAILHPTSPNEISIEQAMARVLPALKIAPDAPVGLTTPGGTGMEFSHSLSQLPPQYQQGIPSTAPQIRGEIHKNAQK